MRGFQEGGQHEAELFRHEQALRSSPKESPLLFPRGNASLITTPLIIHLIVYRVSKVLRRGTVISDNYSYRSRTTKITD